MQPPLHRVIHKQIQNILFNELYCVYLNNPIKFSQDLLCISTNQSDQVLLAISINLLCFHVYDWCL